MAVAVAGYSGTPLAKKLGIEEGARVALLGAPDGFDAELAPLPDGVRVLRRLAAHLDVAVLFVTSRGDLERRLQKVAACLQAAGALWVAWPKKASKVATDLDENVVRDLILSDALVDNKICAIDDTWSGLRFVYRLSARGAARPTACPGANMGW